MRTFHSTKAKLKSQPTDIIRGCMTVIKLDGIEFGIFAPDLWQLKRAWKHIARDEAGNLIQTFQPNESQKVAMVLGKNLVASEEVAA
jgi:hypothetical protein